MASPDTTYRNRKVEPGGYFLSTRHTWFGLLLPSLRSRHACTGAEFPAKQYDKSDIIEGTFIALKTTPVLIHVYPDTVKTFPSDPGRDDPCGFDVSYRIRQSETTGGKFRMSDCIKISNMAICFSFVSLFNLAETKTTPTGKMMAKSCGKNIKARWDIVRIALVAILALGLSLSHACAALSSLEPPSFCKAEKSISHQVDHVKKASCKLRPCNPGQGRALLTKELAEIRDSKNTHLFPATILPSQLSTISTPAVHRRTARTHLLHPLPNNPPPIYIKLCSLLR